MGGATYVTPLSRVLYVTEKGLPMIHCESHDRKFEEQLHMECVNHSNLPVHEELVRAIGKKKVDVSNSFVAATRSSVEIEVAWASAGHQKRVIRLQDNGVVGNED